jgi:hypothetical protein
MNLRRWLAPVFVPMMLAGCTEPATGTGQMLHPPYAPDNTGEYLRDRSGDGSDM